MTPGHSPMRGAFSAHLGELGIDQLDVHPDPVKIATEAALWGSINHHGLLNDTVIVSDGAGQFRVGQHGLCWVHAERLIHKLTGFNDSQRRAIDLVRQLVWWFYADLKAYKRDPEKLRATQLRARFDRIFKRKTGFATLDRLLARLHARKPELLLVLDRPEIPLHTNGSENDIRCHVTKRKISGGTWSDAGRQARDTLLGCMKTCQKLNVSFFQFLGHRLSPCHTRQKSHHSPSRHRRKRLIARAFAPVTTIGCILLRRGLDFVPQGRRKHRYLQSNNSVACETATVMNWRQSCFPAMRTLSPINICRIQKPVKFYAFYHQTSIVSYLKFNHSLIFRLLGFSFLVTVLLSSQTVPPSLFAPGKPSLAGAPFSRRLFLFSIEEQA
ncbi:MAG: transposase [Geminicoccaceae bacterium]